MKCLVCLFLLVQSVLLAFGQNETNASGQTRLLGVPEPSSASSATQFVSVDLQQAITLYASFKKRTVLQHPQLQRQTFSVRANPQSDSEAATAFEEMFKEKDIATIPDGDKFVMIVPAASINAVSPQSSGVVATNILMPEMSVNFVNMPVSMVLGVYGDYLGHKIVNHDQVPSGAPINFVQTTALSKTELCYALETLLAWRNIRVVPNGNDFKWEYIQARH